MGFADVCLFLYFCKIKRNQVFSACTSTLRSLLAKLRGPYGILEIEFVLAMSISSTLLLYYLLPTPRIQKSLFSFLFWMGNEKYPKIEKPLESFPLWKSYLAEGIHPMRAGVIFNLKHTETPTLQKWQRVIKNSSNRTGNIIHQVGCLLCIQLN